MAAAAHRMTTTAAASMASAAAVALAANATLAKSKHANKIRVFRINHLCLRLPPESIGF